jgi:hypothetical protein
MVISHGLRRELGRLRNLLRRHGIDTDEGAGQDGGAARPA